MHEAIGNVFIGETMKAVTTNTLVVKIPRDGIAIINKGVGAMKSRIKTGNLGNIAKALLCRLNTSKIVGLM